MSSLYWKECLQPLKRETHLIDALNTANTNVVNAFDDFTVAQTRTAAAITAVNNANQEKAAAEASEAAIQADLTAKRLTHSEKQTAHDEEIPVLNNEQRVLRDVINMLKGLPISFEVTCDARLSAIDDTMQSGGGAFGEYGDFVEFKWSDGSSYRIDNSPREFKDKEITIPGGPFTVSLSLHRDHEPLHLKLVDDHNLLLECTKGRNEQDCVGIDLTQTYYACAR